MPQKICMFVWNDLKFDARVQKELLTLTQANHEVTVLYLSNKSHIERLDKSTLLAYQLPFHQWLDQCSKPSLRFFLKTIIYGFTYLHITIRSILKTYDVYHAHDVVTLPAMWIAAKIRGKKLVYDAHELTIKQDGIIPQKIRLFRFIEKTLCPSTDAMITTTHMRAQLFAEYYGIKKPLVLQNRPLHSPILQKNHLRKLLNLSNDDFIALYQGGFQTGRGLTNLIQIAKEMPYIHLVLIGYGDQEIILKNMSIDVPNIHFISAIVNSKLLQYTADADVGMQVLLNTCLNHYTTDSNKLFEYIMAGVPVIASDFPEIRKIITFYQVGRLVNPDNLDEIKEIIHMLYINKTLRENYKINCLKAAQDVSWERQAYRLVELYDQLSY